MTGEKVVRLTGEVDPAQVGVKCAQLAELTGAGLRVPEGFAVTAAAYQEFVRSARLRPVIAQEIRRYRHGRDVQVVAAAIRTAFHDASVPDDLADAILEAYAGLGGEGTEVAVRCSPVVVDEGVRDEVFLHLHTGADVVGACRRCFASLFSAVAVAGRELDGVDHLAAVMPVTVERMVRSDLGASGTARGENTLVRIRAAWGLGDPPPERTDQYSVRAGTGQLLVKHHGSQRSKIVYADPRGTREVPTTRTERSALVLTDEEIRELAQWSVAADRYFHRPTELEWAKDGRTGALYVIEVRPGLRSAIAVGAPGDAVRKPVR
ncbi:pyruvate phosphate dikinase-like enzyme [Kribbella amoyensis]|uniref:Phosphoenolpyruvate synthase n=1 Tax=Kribbella amoyensis TaxID=996641 RepID=A0A561C086_9ACTN|nr:PEP/pyruvate-binding domain-containing protein [Kribbella amoyensis]TWD84606.1 pyruvate phosphate dikinase-like enzyme [Kribbella amoyensis]